MTEAGRGRDKGTCASRYLLIGVLCLFGAAVLDGLSHREEKILLASAQMRDGIFSQTVIIIGGNWLTGWNGAIINKPLNETEKKLLPEYIRALNRDVGFGGPVGFPDKYYVLERREDKLTGKSGHWLQEWEAALRDRPGLPELIRKDTVVPYRYRIFAGFSGWAPFQLENEFAMSDSWEGMAPEPDIVWKPGPDTTWEAIRHKQQELLKRPMRTL